MAEQTLDESIGTFIQSIKIKSSFKKEFKSELEKYIKDWMDKPGMRSTQRFNDKVREMSKKYKADISTKAMDSIMTNMKKKHDLFALEEVGTASAIGSHSASDGRNNASSPPMPNIPCPDGNFGGKPYFNCDGETFSKARLGRNKGQRWSTFLGSKNDWADGVRNWARKNGNPSFLLKNGNTFMYAQKSIKKGA